MPDLNHRKQKIQEKRKKTPWREFLKEIVSWRPVTFHKQDGMITRFPKTERISGVQSSVDLEKQRDSLIENGVAYDVNKPFFEQFQQLYKSFPQEAMLHV